MKQVELQWKMLAKRVQLLNCSSTSSNAIMTDYHIAGKVYFDLPPKGINLRGVVVVQNILSFPICCCLSNINMLHRRDADAQCITVL